MTSDVVAPASETTAANGHGEVHSTASLKALLIGSIGVEEADKVIKGEKVPASAPVAWWEMPLVWFNAAFDLCLKPLGPVGEALRSPVGRFTLAVLGMGCLVAAAVVLFIDWFGWPS